MKRMTLCIAIWLFLSVTAFSQDHKILEVYDQGQHQKKAVVYDRKTGQTFTVEKGDRIGNGIITEITSEEVTVITPQDGGRPALITRKPVGEKNKRMKILRTDPIKAE